MIDPRVNSIRSRFGFYDIVPQYRAKSRACLDHEDRRWFEICTSSVLCTIKRWMHSFHIPSNLSRRTKYEIKNNCFFNVPAWNAMLIGNEAEISSETMRRKYRFDVKRTPPIFPETLLYKINQQNFLKISNKDQLKRFFDALLIILLSLLPFSFVSMFTRCCVNYSIIVWTIVFRTFYVISTRYDFIIAGHFDLISHRKRVYRLMLRTSRTFGTSMIPHDFLTEYWPLSN